MKRTFLFADPAAHSRSPGMHNAAFAVAGIGGLYQARQVSAAGLADAVAGLRAPDVLGANLSLPHKEAVLPLLDELTPAAQAIGAVNTIINRNGVLIGDNTDAPGLGEDLSGLLTGVPHQFGTVVVLGAGGAARAAVHFLLSQNARVYVLNRTFEHAQKLVSSWHTLDVSHRLIAARRENIPWHEAELIVNASSAGLDAPDESPLPGLPPLKPGALVYDMVYKPAQTRLMKDARAAGYRAENGLGMLAQQARLAFLAWTGADVPIAVFLNALESPSQSVMTGSGTSEAGPSVLNPEVQR